MSARVVHCRRAPFDVHIGRGRDPVSGEPGEWGNPYSHRPSRVSGIIVVDTVEEAAASMRQLAPERAPVVLRADSVADTRDRYGRLLAHAFIAGRQLEVAQLRQGWAEVYRFDGLSRFERAEDQARRADRGVWSTCAANFQSSR